VDANIRSVSEGSPSLRLEHSILDDESVKKTQDVIPTGDTGDKKVLSRQSSSLATPHGQFRHSSGSGKNESLRPRRRRLKDREDEDPPAAKPVNVPSSSRKPPGTPVPPSSRRKKSISGNPLNATPTARRKESIAVGTATSGTLTSRTSASASANAPVPSARRKEAVANTGSSTSRTKESARNLGVQTPGNLTPRKKELSASNATQGIPVSRKKESIGNAAMLQAAAPKVKEKDNAVKAVQLGVQKVSADQASKSSTPTTGGIAAPTEKTDSAPPVSSTGGSFPNPPLAVVKEMSLPRIVPGGLAGTLAKRNSRAQIQVLDEVTIMSTSTQNLKPSTLVENAQTENRIPRAILFSPADTNRLSAVAKFAPTDDDSRNHGKFRKSIEGIQGLFGRKK